MHYSTVRQVFTLVLVITVLSTTSCHKKTSTDFRLERYTYAPGETLDLINLSPKKRNQVWEIINPDGDSDTVVAGQAPQLIIDILAEDGIYTLQAYDNIKEMGKDLSVESKKTFMVTADRGKVRIYSNQFTSFPFDLTIDGHSLFGKHGITYNIPVGKHIIKASGIYYSGGPTHSLDTVVTINSQSTTNLYLN